MNGSLVEDPLIYLKEPEVTAPFSIGTLSEQTLNSAIDMLNQVRYIAGLSYHVSLKDNYNTHAQAASLVNYVNNRLDHFPSQSKEMKDSLYELGRIGASSSNIAWSFAETEYVGSMILHMWMADDDSTNIDRAGYRRWILNPCMGATGFGAVSGNNNGEKFVTDRHGASVTGYFTYDGKSYYAKKDGTLLCNDFTPDRRRYASEDGSFIIGKFSANGKTYITDEQGLLYDYETPLEYHGKYYYVKEDGSLAYNEFVDNGWCYATKDYYLQTGEFMVDEKKYIANEKGCLYKKNGKFQYNGNYYYASEDGSLVKDEFIAGLWYATDNYTLLTNGAKVIGNEKYFFNKRANIKGSYDLMKGRSIVKYNIKANDKYKVFNSKNITIPKKIIVKEGTSFRLCNADIGIGCSVSGSVSGNWLFNNKFKINGDTDFKINIKMNGKVKTYKVEVKVKK